ncbi:MAG: hypothetical protein QOH71_3598 [Blastocatellia bacterium]|nr:hypothetical protein [Blastocatellia bacterium]
MLHLPYANSTLSSDDVGLGNAGADQPITNLDSWLPGLPKLLVVRSLDGVSSSRLGISRGSLTHLWAFT